MRTTLNIDDGLVEVLKNKAYETGKSFEQVVNETLLKGLSDVRKPYRLRQISMGTVPAEFNIDKALGLADELEDVAIEDKDIA